MPYKRITAALLLLLSAAYCRFCMPTVYEKTVSLVQEALDYEQLIVSLPEEMPAWLSLD